MLLPFPDTYHSYPAWLWINALESESSSEQDRRAPTWVEEECDFAFSLGSVGHGSLDVEPHTERDSRVDYLRSGLY